MEDPYRMICDAAAALFAEKGFDNTSLQDVATAVGVTKAGLYHYFPTKHALFEAIVLDTLRDLHAGAVAAIAAHNGYPDKLTAFMTAHARYFSEHGERYRASFFGRGGGGERANLTPDERAMRKAYVQLLGGRGEGRRRRGHDHGFRCAHLRQRRARHAELDGKMVSPRRAGSPPLKSPNPTPRYCWPARCPDRRTPFRTD